MKPLVTIGIPIYKRLHFLPDVLRVVSSQDYPNIELIVSDNGANGSSVQELVGQHYSRPYRLRQNLSTVSISKHFNQIVDAASGQYFLLLADDDKISPNYVSEMLHLLKRLPQASLAIARQEILNESGISIRSSNPIVPEIVSGPAFIRSAWGGYEYKFECFATFMARTADIRACGGFPDFKTGSHNDNALLIKLCLNSYVALSSKCTFGWRVYDNSHGWSIGIWDLAQDTRQFLRFLRMEPTVLGFGSRHPSEWRELKKLLARMAWKTYFNRWNEIYKQRLSMVEWVYAAFAMPPIPAYYREIGFTLCRSCKNSLSAWLNGIFHKHSQSRL